MPSDASGEEQPGGGAQSGSVGGLEGQGGNGWRQQLVVTHSEGTERDRVGKPVAGATVRQLRRG